MPITFMKKRYKSIPFLMITTILAMCIFGLMIAGYNLYLERALLEHERKQPHICDKCKKSIKEEKEKETTKTQGYEFYETVKNNQIRELFKTKNDNWDFNKLEPMNLFLYVNDKDCLIVPYIKDYKECIDYEGEPFKIIFSLINCPQELIRDKYYLIGYYKLKEKVRGDYVDIALFFNPLEKKIYFSECFFANNNDILIDELPPFNKKY